jgi:hypothetical protein
VDKLFFTGFSLVEAGAEAFSAVTSSEMIEAFAAVESLGISIEELEVVGMTGSWVET